MKVLFVLTSHDDLGDTGEKTGFWLEEFASPYYTFTDAGVRVTLASPKGGQPPKDPKSDNTDAQTEATHRFNGDSTAQQELASTMKLADVNAADFDAVFYPGGHGPLWDLYQDENSIGLIEQFIAAEKPVAAVCHAPAVLLQARKPNGEPLVKGKKVTGFSNSEEQGVGLTDVVPYMLEDELKANGAQYQKVDDWQVLSITDGLLVTGQNPGSSEAVAKGLLKLLQ
ncbi:type 1 glutamine amidotransferase domain-containing protein [Marinicella litoralis]|uniref:Putative intracellular protease/amidase n=1 Tax=Marinicella litoralis TaxID=644220 RepID=A0A4R6XJD6_9GAMM|nr:type 1 glutamine amidotransferase domain-containing protein [Marinicella litoralis]TDR18459.1 putative intracellular protease/amidase [Marinicella litoralis]